jgi:hypothetical protein
LADQFPIRRSTDRNLFGRHRSGYGSGSPRALASAQLVVHEPPPECCFPGPPRGLPFLDPFARPSRKNERAPRNPGGYTGFKVMGSPAPTSTRTGRISRYPGPRWSIPVPPEQRSALMIRHSRQAGSCLRRALASLRSFVEIGALLIPDNQIAAPAKRLGVARHDVRHQSETLCSGPAGDRRCNCRDVGGWACNRGLSLISARFFLESGGPLRLWPRQLLKRRCKDCASQSPHHSR